MSPLDAIKSITLIMNLVISHSACVWVCVCMCVYVGVHVTGSVKNSTEE